MKVNTLAVVGKWKALHIHGLNLSQCISCAPAAVPWITEDT